MKECPNCKTILEDDELFCHECGTKQEVKETAVSEEETASPVERKCIHCGETIEEDSAFCPFCGKPQAMEEVKEEEPIKEEHSEKEATPVLQEETGEEEQQEEVTPAPQEETAEGKQQEEEIPTQEKQQEDVSTPATPEEKVEEKQLEKEKSQEQVSGPAEEEPVPEEAPDDSEEDEVEHHSKKWLWILCSILLIGVISGGVYFYLNQNEKRTNDDVINDEEEDYIEENLTERQAGDSDDKQPTAKDIKNNFKEKYSRELSMLEERAWEELHELGEISFMGVPCSDCWVTSITLSNISVISETKAKAEARVVYESADDRSTQTNDVTLILENGSWVIDDYDGWKGFLQKKLDEAKNAEDKAEDEAEGEALSQIATRNRAGELWRCMEMVDGIYSDVLHRKITESDLENFSKEELSILRNSIYAHHGYRFTRDDLFSYFSQFSWYDPTTSDMSAAYNEMSDIEKYNIDFIKSHE